MGGGILAPPTSNPFQTLEVSLSNASTAVNDHMTALLPDPGTEGDFKVDNNPFAFSPGQLNKLFNPKSLPALQALGGLQGIAHGLQSDTHTGLSIDEATVPLQFTFDQAVHGATIDKKTERSHSGGQPFEDRIRVYGRNVLPPKKATPLWRLVWNAYKDTVLIVLTVAAAISLALGLYETFGAEHPPGSPTPVDWVEGLAICIAIAITQASGKRLHCCVGPPVLNSAATPRNSSPSFAAQSFARFSDRYRQLTVDQGNMYI